MTTDAFENILEGEAVQRQAWTEAADGSAVRRPTRGLEIKEDTPASLKVIDAAGNAVPLVSSSAEEGNPGMVDNYTNFILQSVTEARMEKHQIVETFGESYIFFFGESPRFLDVTVTLVNSFDFNWEAEWWENYENNLRGTKLVERGARLYMFYDDNVVEGYMLNAQGAKVSEQPHMITLSFRMYVTSYRNITFIGDTNYPTHRSVTNEVAQQYRAPGSRVGAAAGLQGEASSRALDQNFADAQDLGIISRPQGVGTPLGTFPPGSTPIGANGQAIDLVKPPDFGGQTAQQREDSAISQQLQNDVGQKSSLTQLLSASPVSGAFSPETILGLAESGQATTQDLADALGDAPLRGRIWDNTDEYVGGGTYSSFSDLPSAMTPIIRDQQEVEDLWLATISAMSCYGADLNNRKAMQDIGLMPNFGNDGLGRGTFRPAAEVSAGVGFGIGEPPRSQAQQDRIARDPLGAVFGRTDVGINDRSTVQGAGDSEYGYASDYGTAPGVGRPGYGDYGGNGFGSGQGAEGDPGFRDPKTFSFAGVQASAGAFSRFNKAKPNNTVFGKNNTRIGLGASNSGLPGGGNTMVEGQPSAFAMISTPGVFGEPVPPQNAPFGVVAGAQAGAGAVAGVSASGVFVAAAGASVSVHLGFGLGHGRGERCPPPLLSVGVGAAVGAGVGVGF